MASLAGLFFAIYRKALYISLHFSYNITIEAKCLQGYPLS